MLYSDFTKSFVDTFSDLNSALPIIVILAPFLIVTLILVPIYMAKGFKNGLFRGLIALGATVLSFILSMPAAKGIALLLSKPLVSLLFDKVVSLLDLGELAQAAENMTYVSSLVTGVVTAAAASILFFILFIVFLAIIRGVFGVIFGRMLSGAEIGKGLKFTGMLVGLIDALLISCLLFAPLYTVIRTSAVVEKNTAYELYHDNSEKIEESTKLSDNILKCPPVWVSDQPVFRFARTFYGSFECENEKYNIYDIVEDGAEIVFGASGIVDKKVAEYGKEETDLIDKLTDIAGENRFFYGVSADLLNYASDYVNNPKNEQSEYVVKLLEPVRGCTAASVEKALIPIGNIFTAAIDKGVLRVYGDTGALLEKISDKEFVDTVVSNMRSSEMTSGIMDNVLLISIDAMEHSAKDTDEHFAESLTELRAEINEKIKSGNVDAKEETRSFEMLTSGISGVYSCTDGFEALSVDKLNSDAFSSLIYGISLHPYVGQNGAEKFVRAFLPSLGEYSGSVFTDAVVDKMVGALIEDLANPALTVENGKFSNLLRSTKTMADTVSAMTDLSNVDKTKIKESVGKLLTDMTPDSADVIAGAITGELVKELGVTGGKEDKVSEFVGNVILNMSEVNADGAQFEKEQNAISEMMSLVLTANEKVDGVSKDGVSSIESAIDGSLTDLIYNASESEVMMNSVKKLLEGGDKDPTGMFTGLASADRSAIEKAVSEASKRDGADLEDLKLLAGFMGLEIG